MSAPTALIFFFNRFRGLIASASLKAVERVQRLDFSRVIPRLDCLGLIEGPPCPASCEASTIPRLDCLGLIEGLPFALEEGLVSAPDSEA